ncbi:MAG: hypothetical protein WC868_02130 [Bacteroidales bacterium]
MTTLRKPKKIKTKKVLFRLSLRQKKIIDKYCIAHNLTKNKLIKYALKEYMFNHYDLPDDECISENQLKLFHFEDELIKQPKTLIHFHQPTDSE